MIQIVCGEKGKGKTKVMLEKANELVKESNGLVAYLDKNSKHMYELSNNIRLINVFEYPVNSYEGFLGFISGLLSGNNDIEVVFFDSFLRIANLEGKDITAAIETLDKLSGDKKFILSISLDKSMIPESLQDNIISAC